MFPTRGGILGAELCKRETNTAKRPVQPVGRTKTSNFLTIGAEFLHPGAVLWTDFPSWFLVGIAVCLGLLFGSFLNVVIYRLPRGQNVAFPPSSCPACGAAIRPWHNIPVFSWLWLRGKAACCGAPIRPRYPLVELLGGLSGWAVMLSVSNELTSDTPAWLGGLSFAVHLALCLGLIAAAFIDMEFMIFARLDHVGWCGAGARDHCRA